MADKRKILVLVMSCNREHFIEQEKVCRETWAKPILDGAYDNIEYYSYTTDINASESYINKEKHKIFCNCDDGIYMTYQKTVECLKVLDKEGIKYDYLFRTNTSTYNNIGLLNAFVQSIENENIAYGGEIYNLPTLCPAPHFCYLRGNSILLSRHLVDIILDFDKHVSVPKVLYADDNMIGNILNTYHILRFEPYKMFIRSYGFAWYKSVEEKANSKFIKLNNGCSAWYNSDDSYDYLKNFISIQIKNYTNRDVENKRMRYIDTILNKTKDDYTEELKFIENYSKNAKYYYHDSVEKIDEYRDYYPSKKNKNQS